VSLPVTVCCTYFKSLGLDNLRAALYSLRRSAGVELVDEIIVVDNATDDTQPEIAAVINEQAFPVPTRLLSFKHDDPTRTHSWSTNVAFREARSPWVFFTRADYIVDPALLARSLQMAAAHGAGWKGFVTADGYHLQADVLACDVSGWRERGAHELRTLPGTAFDYTLIDTGVYLLNRETFEKVGGLDERLTVWGHAQTEFQWRIHKAHVDMARIADVLYYHPMHGAPRDLAAATAQLAQHGVDIKDCWARYEKEHIYR
jgi:glycosyltransferase involved in cell wall biosynthesis